jgi:hypothetical protein
VVFLPVEVVVLARFWRLGMVLVLVVSFLRFGSDGDGCRFGFLCSCSVLRFWGVVEVVVKGFLSFPRWLTVGVVLYRY